MSTSESIGDAYSTARVRRLVDAQVRDFKDCFYASSSVGKLLLIFVFVALLLVAAVGDGVRTLDCCIRAFEQDVGRSQTNGTRSVAMEAYFKKQVQE